MDMVMREAGKTDFRAVVALAETDANFRIVHRSALLAGRCVRVREPSLTAATRAAVR